MLLSTTPSIDGRRIHEYKGVVTGEAILGANVFRDIVGGRSASYEKVLRDARDMALAELSEEARKLGANAVVGIDLDYETIGTGGSMLMVSASGTAVVVD